MHIQLGNHTSIGKVRTANEDAFGNWQTPNGHLFVVCDGMGGHIGGAIASQSAVAAIYQTMASQKYPSAPVALRHCLEEANRKLHRIVLEKPALQGMGTTAVVVLLQGADAYYTHLGDSRLYLYRQGTLRRLTKDHSFVQSLVDGGHITEAEAERHPRKNEIYRALGIGETIDPTVCADPVKLQPDDLLILCTDGLNGMIGDAAIARALGEGAQPVQEIAERLIQLADAAGGHDNSTVQLLRWMGDRPATAPPVAAASAATAPPAAVAEPAVTARRKKPLLPVLGGIALFVALLVVAYNFFSKPPAPKLGMEGIPPADTAAAAIPADTGTGSIPAPTAPPLTPPKPIPVQAAPKKDSATPAASPVPAAPRKERPADSVRKTAPPKPVLRDTLRKAPAPKPAVVPAPKPTPPPVPKNKPAADTVRPRPAKAVMPPAEQAP